MRPRHSTPFSVLSAQCRDRGIPPLEGEAKVAKGTEEAPPQANEIDPFSKTRPGWRVFRTNRNCAAIFRSI